MFRSAGAWWLIVRGRSGRRKTYVRATERWSVHRKAWDLRVWASRDPPLWASFDAAAYPSDLLRALERLRQRHG